MCSLNEVREQTPSSRRSVVHSQSSHKVDVLSKGQVRGVVLDNRFTCGLGEKPKSLEDMGIDIDLYKGAVRGCSPEELRHHIEGYWSLPPEDRGRLTRPMTMHVTVTVVLNGVCWRLKCLVDGGAARNVLSSSVYECDERWFAAHLLHSYQGHMHTCERGRVSAGGLNSQKRESPPNHDGLSEEGSKYP